MSEHPPKRQRMSTVSMVDSKLDITGKTVKIKVTQGSDTQVFLVHENVLKKGSSPFFKARLRKEWIAISGGDEAPIVVDGHRPQTFELYVKWLYSGVFDLEQKGWTDGTFDLEQNGWTGLVSAYILGDEILDREFQNSILAATINQSASGSFAVPGSRAVNMAYESLPEGSPLRRFFVYIFAIALVPKAVEESLDERYHHEFLLEVVMAMKKSQEGRKAGPGEAWPVRIKDYMLKDVEVDGRDGGAKNKA